MSVFSCAALGGLGFGARASISATISSMRQRSVRAAYGPAGAMGTVIEYDTIRAANRQRAIFQGNYCAGMGERSAVRLASRSRRAPR
jgi:hypothetical protein